MMAERRRRFQLSFSLRTLLIVFTLLTCWLGWNIHRVRQREQAIQYITSLGGQVFYGPPEKPWKRVPMAWQLLGAKPVEHIFGRGAYYDDGDQEQLRVLFPEAQIQL